MNILALVIFVTVSVVLNELADLWNAREKRNLYEPGRLARLKQRETK